MVWESCFDNLACPVLSNLPISQRLRCRSCLGDIVMATGCMWSMVLRTYVIHYCKKGIIAFPYFWKGSEEKECVRSEGRREGDHEDLRDGIRSAPIGKKNGRALPQIYVRSSSPAFRFRRGGERTNGRAQRDRYCRSSERASGITT